MVRGRHTHGRRPCAAPVVPDSQSLRCSCAGAVAVALPATGFVVEVLGDFMLDPPLPDTHVRIGSTQQFCE